MEVSDDGDVAAGVEKALFDCGNGGRGFGDVDSPANDFGAGFGEFERLFERGFDVGGVRVGHGLDDDGCAAANLDVADLYAVGFAAWVARGGGVGAGAGDLGERGHRKNSLPVKGADSEVGHYKDRFCRVARLAASTCGDLAKRARYIVPLL